MYLNAYYILPSRSGFINVTSALKILFWLKLTYRQH